MSLLMAAAAAWMPSSSAGRCAAIRVSTDSRCDSSVMARLMIDAWRRAVSRSAAGGRTEVLHDVRDDGKPFRREYGPGRAEVDTLVAPSSRIAEAGDAGLRDCLGAARDVQFGEDRRDVIADRPAGQAGPAAGRGGQAGRPVQHVALRG
ncbi:hypothetical protein [Dactylosporangium sp. NPDC049140]|uniref:hypothetical protein n=1 Tax=Dactylosporangium sp. NPDC049140 TaxID=3155647 RepID=UPI0033FBCCF6